MRSLGRRLGGARPVALAFVVAVVMLGAPAGIVLSAAPRSSGEFPRRLEDTGLYSDIATHTLASDVLGFEPQYPLWSDGASKRRWIRIPSGTWIDARDPDRFAFPIGTRLWKEFALGARVETRYLELAADGKWRFASYQWSADERSAFLAPEAGVRAASEAAPGVPFDIPGRADCLACHAAGASPVLGFNALQLSSDRDPLAPHSRPLPEGALDLDDFVECGFVRNLPEQFVRTPPRIRAATPRERAALGYLSSNCGICHTSGGALHGLEFDLSYSLARPEPAPALATALDRASRFRWPSDVDPRRIASDSPELSVLTRRMASRNPMSRMPPLGTRLRDEAALELVTDWIREDLVPASRSETSSPDLPTRNLCKQSRN